MSHTSTRTALADATTSDPRWRAVRSRDVTADGTFYYSVKTTGVYCRPSCGARLARPENVEFHATCADAEQRGFRPCKRCRPADAGAGDRKSTMVAAACRLIEGADAAVPLE